MSKDLLAEIKKDILAKALNEEQLFQKFFVDSNAFFFTDVIKKCDEEYQLKSDIARVLNVHLNDIYLVGSAKTGFSTKPKARGKKFDEVFLTSGKIKDKSDLDIAIVSTELFDRLQEGFYDWSNGFKIEWDSNSYYSNGTEQFGVSLKYRFLEYLAKGWFRPDYCHASFPVSTKSGNIKDVQAKWKNKFGRTISYAIYKNWFFFKKYQIEGLNEFKKAIESGDLL